LNRKSTFPGRAILTGAAVASLIVAAPHAAALGLGRLTVQSALGETMQAEIEITSLTPEEASNLKVRVAPPEQYRAQNVDYNAVLPGTRAVIVRRPDGRQFVRLISDRSVQEPFVDVILEISWASGRLVREYTLLFDPPTTYRAQAPAPTTQVAQSAATDTPAPSASPAPSAAPAPAATDAPPPVSRGERRAAERQAAAEARQAAADSRRAAAEARRSATPSGAAEEPPPVATRSPARTPDVAGDEYRVRSGDTLSHIATRTQRPGVSLDQMLVALFRANPDAFMGNNMNRLRSGVVLSLPSADSAQSVSVADARNEIRAQSADFGAYRQKLAANAPPTKAEGSTRSATGKVQTKVEDTKTAGATSPDKLTLSKGSAAPANAAAEEKLSQDKARVAADQRVAELRRNVGELDRLKNEAAKPGAVAAAPTPPTTATPPATTAPATPGIPAARPSTTVPAAPPVVVAQAQQPPVATPAKPTPTPPAATPPTATAPAAATTPAPAAAASATPATTTAATATNPATPPAATTIAAASAPAATASAAAPPPARTAAASASRPANTARRKPPVEEPGFFGSLIDDNPLLLGGGALIVALLAGFGIYTVAKRGKKESGETSFLESRLQPDSFFGASGGQRIDTRDAAGSSSSMTYSLSQLDAIGDVDPVAEADVYLAYGRDLQAEEILKEAMRGNPERLAIRTKLLEVYAKRRDTKGFEMLANQLFALTRGEGEEWAKAQQLGAEIDPDNPLYQPGGAPSEAARIEAPEPLGASTLPQSVVPVPTSYGQSIQSIQMTDSAFGALDLDLDNPDVGHPSAPGVLDSIQPEKISLDPGFADSTHKMPLVANDVTVPVVAKRDEPLPFDMSGFSIDLDKAGGATATASAGHDAAVAEMELPQLDLGQAHDPMVRKLELADEFRQIGDKDGARDLLREVLAKASGSTRTKAQSMLDDLG
jgi:pilus assembly protein FimV